MGCDVLDRAVPGPAPFKRVIEFSFNDGPTDGVVECGDSVFYDFRLVAWRLERYDRIYVFSPIPREVAEEVATLSDGFDPDIHRAEDVLQRLAELLDQRGPAEYLVMMNETFRALIRCTALRDPDLRRQVELRVLKRVDWERRPFLYSLDPHEHWVSLLEGRVPVWW